MSCGCKNKNNGGQQQPPSQPTNVAIGNTQQQTDQSVKNVVTKIVEKYYNKK